MIISNNKKPNKEEFKSVVFKANNFLNNDAKIREEYYLKRNAKKLEEDVYNALNTVTVGTPFEKTIELVSGQRFPDIIAGKYYGIEVKSSTNENWITLGGSVNESTRIEDVERIFLTFGKLVSPIEFCSRPYEDCLSEVVVTHYPRYKIDMKLRSGETIFDKMRITYDDLRNNQNPVKKIVEYYKTQLSEGESLWWIDNTDKDESNNYSTSIKVKLWRTLPQDTKQELMITGLAFFPELFSNSIKKYESFSLWLVSQHGIVSTSLRDTFTAGGQQRIKTTKGTFENMPQIIYKVFNNSSKIAMKINLAEKSLLKEYWKVRNINSDRIGQWIELVSQNYTSSEHNIHKVIEAIFGR